MAGMLILKPLPIAQVSTGGTGIANLTTPSPREVWISPSTAGGVSIDFDLGSELEVDSFYLGGTNARSDGTWAVVRRASLGGAAIDVPVATKPMRLSGGIRSRHPAFEHLAAPITGRFFSYEVNQPVTPLEIGNLIIGKAFEAPYAYGSGRQPVDTSKVVALPDGGFGIERGVVKSSLSWRFADLDNAQLETLWALAEDRGESAPLVVVEGPDYPPKAPSVHYGLFRRFEAFEREDAAFTKWQLSIEEWR